ncbi:60S ribosomal protein L29-like [Nannospalax galili]|uniref:60S ribosomal protein L29-like n=1 Tax=Nannospalax galili TaxID=1026970 RepID=UPI0004ED0EF3|nr:60S ribosomal protein L29-like [Nannospalax galili]
MRFSTKHKKGLEKKQTNNAKAVGAEPRPPGPLRSLGEVWPKRQKSATSKFCPLAFISCSKLGKRTPAYMAKGHGLCQSKAQAQIKVGAAALAQAQASVPALAPPPV